jgi:hypothetical protein
MTRPYQVKVRIGPPIKFPPGSNPQDIAEQLKFYVEQL